MKKKKIKYIFVAKNSGFCWGVKRAYNMVIDALKKYNKPIYILGDLIHNKYVVNSLENKGLKRIKSLKDIKDTDAYIVIRSHGITKDIYDKIKKMKLNIIDTTCPFVKFAQEKVAQLKNENYNIIIVGDKKHSEVEGLISMAGNEHLIIEKLSDIDIEKINSLKKIGLVFQTTQNMELAKKIIYKLIEISRNPKEIRVFNTLCDATTERQNETRHIAKKVNLMIIIGGYNSANTKRLVDIASNFTKTIHIEEPEQLNHKHLMNITKIGISAGASTPNILVNKLIKKIKETMKTNGSKVIIKYFS